MSTLHILCVWAYVRLCVRHMFCLSLPKCVCVCDVVVCMISSHKLMQINTLPMLQLLIQLEMLWHINSLLNDVIFLEPPMQEVTTLIFVVLFWNLYFRHVIWRRLKWIRYHHLLFLFITQHVERVQPPSVPFVHSEMKQIVHPLCNIFSLSTLPILSQYVLFWVTGINNQSRSGKTIQSFCNDYSHTVIPHCWETAPMLRKCENNMYIFQT